MFGCFFFNERCHIFPDEFSKHTKQGELGFHLKGHASFNPWVSQSYSLWFLWATFRSRLASILLTASGTLRITLSLQNCTAKSPDFCVSLRIFVLGSMDRLITYIGFPGWFCQPLWGIRGIFCRSEQMGGFSGLSLRILALSLGFPAGVPKVSSGGKHQHRDTNCILDQLLL